MRRRISLILIAFATLLCLSTSCNGLWVDYDVFGSISGTVADKDGNPIQNATVTLIPDTHNTYTGVDGCFEFIELNPNNYDVRATKEGYQPNKVSVTIKAGDHRNISIALSPKE